MLKPPAYPRKVRPVGFLNAPDFTIGKTQMLTNQLGYVKYEEHKYYRNNSNFDL